HDDGPGAVAARDQHEDVPLPLRPGLVVLPTAEPRVGPLRLPPEDVLADDRPAGHPRTLDRPPVPAEEEPGDAVEVAARLGAAGGRATAAAAHRAVRGRRAASARLGASGRRIPRRRGGTARPPRRAARAAAAAATSRRRANPGPGGPRGTRSGSPAGHRRAPS